MPLSLPLRPASMKPFRFLDLPGEIRNKVYQIILCIAELPPSDDTNLHEVPTELIQLRHSIEPQILRTCRSIYIEANYVMCKTNLFIKVTVKVPFDEVLPLLMAKRLPILPIKRENVKKFKAFVMSHEIAVRAPMQEKPRTFVFLHRDLDLFCGALVYGQWQISRHDELVSHIVTLVDPYEHENLPNSQTFFSRKLQEKLIAPYRAALRGFPHFTIKGTVPKDLSAAAVSEITRPRTEDPDSVLHELEQIKAKGNEYFRNGDVRMASETWTGALLEINRVMAGKAGQRLQEVGGVDFINGITALFFDLCSNRAQNYLKPMRDNAADHELVSSLNGGLFHAINDAWGAMERFPGATWEPSPQQVAKLLYREAVGCRLVGDLESLLQGEASIERAIRTMPGDAELEREKRRISERRNRITGRVSYQ